MLLYKGGLNNYCQNTFARGEKAQLSRLTTYGLGGFADKVYFPQTPYEAKAVYSSALAMGEKIFILGNGSDVLASDEGFRGSIICTRKMKGIIRLKENRITCLAGTDISSVLTYCKNNELGGIEYMYGIPASIGGAAYMNAGVGEFSISQNIESVSCFGDICGKIGAEKCNFGYRHSTMRDINALILAVTLKLEHVSRNEICKRTEYFREKRAHLPKGRSCGCVFMNGEGYSSGELIDKAGLKGAKRGGAYISCEHANFIINRGGSASDVKYLIELAKGEVYSRFGVKLREEVVYIGEFNDFNG